MQHTFDPTPNGHFTPLTCNTPPPILSFHVKKKNNKLLHDGHWREVRSVIVISPRMYSSAKSSRYDFCWSYRNWPQFLQYNHINSRACTMVLQIETSFRPLKRERKRVGGRKEKSWPQPCGWLLAHKVVDGSQRQEVKNKKPEREKNHRN